MSLARKLKRFSGEVPITSPLHPNLSAMYTMDNISGATLVDESTNGNDATITGATTAAGLIGNSLFFGNAANDNAAVPLAVCGTGDQIISFHVYYPATPGADDRFLGISQNGASDNVKLLIRNLSGSFQALIANGSATVATINGPAISVATWYHILLDISSGVAEFFVDNVSQGSAAVDISRASSTYYLGNARQANNAGDCRIDQFRHFNGVSASAADRAALYNGGSGA